VLPTVTVITVSRNAEATLQATIDSVRSQDYPHIEHIVVDGASTDGTAEIIRRNAAHLAYWTSEPDAGIYDAMNKGVAKATGEWVILLNADDAFHDGGVVGAVFGKGGAGWKDKLVVYGDSVLRLERGRERFRRSKPLRSLHFKMPFSHQGAFVRTDLLRRRPFDVRLRLAADFDFFREVYARRGETAFFRSPVCVNYFTVGGATYRYLGERHREVLEVIRRHESGWRRGYYVAHYTVRCLLPSYLLDWAERLRRRYARVAQR
jgi:glycosyltransferase involved in cell wall biosynthesis